MSVLGLREHLTHRGNLRTSRYGWLRLTPMYSVHLVNELLDEVALRDRDGRVLDPFCGTGTTALVCGERGVACDTTDINPFLLWLADVKTHAFSADDIETARAHSTAIIAYAREQSSGTGWLPPLRHIEKWWEPRLLGELSRAWDVVLNSKPLPARWLLTIVFLRVAIATAHISFGHQSMSFKRPTGPSPTDEGQRQLLLGDEWSQGKSLFEEEWVKALEVVTAAASSEIRETPRTALIDARTLTEMLERDAYTAVITSPPYCNRMSYIRELRPYMYWMGYLTDGRSAGEMDWQAIGGTWGIATSNVARWAPDDSIDVPFDGFDEIVTRIAESSDVLSRYVSKYFHDVILHLQELVKVVEPGGSTHYIVGNSKFYDVMIPTEDIYASAFESVGFEEVVVRKLRKRTSKKELYEYLVSATKP